MADIAGYGGAFAGPGTAGINLVSINEWSGTYECDTVAVPPSFGELWETAEPTIQRFSGTCKGKLTYNTASTKPIVFTSSSTTGLSAMKGTMTLTAFTGCTITGTFVWQTMSMTRPHAGYAEVTATFRNASTDVATTWDET
jgi:hypothetical protein